ncbi:MAG: hypothetical protein Q4B93_05285 [Clostridia bacterium]|nr:hypothetical protein [Clostridia bacterium]
MIDELAGEILKAIGVLMQMLPEPVKKVLENRAVQGVMKVTGGVSEIATGCGLCTTVAGSLQGLPLIIFGTNMAFEGIQDLWYTLKGELDHESKNLIKEATGHKVDNLVELAEIGMSIYSGKVASKKAVPKLTGELGEESEKLSGLLKKTRKPVSIATRNKRLVRKFMPKKRYRKFKVVDIEELARKQCLKPNIQLFAEKNEIKQIFNSIKESPNFPDGFKSRINGKTCNKVKNMDLLEKLRNVESGKWQKVYKDGYDKFGNKISIHYFRSDSGKVFNVKIKNGWSN